LVFILRFRSYKKEKEKSWAGPLRPMKPNDLGDLEAAPAGLL
jgi:hypothetical protein